MNPTPPAPTTNDIRHAIETIQIGVRDPFLDPAAIAAAHRLLVAAQRIVEPPVKEWLNDYLDEETTAGGADTFRRAVDDLAEHFKLPPAAPVPAPGEQGKLFQLHAD